MRVIYKFQFVAFLHIPIFLFNSSFNLLGRVRDGIEGFDWSTLTEILDYR